MKPAISVMQFPLGGLDKSKAYRSQPAYANGVFTTADALNCRAHEWATDRARGGSRPGLTRYYNDPTHGVHSIQDINQMFLAYVPPEQTFSYWGYSRGGLTGYGIGSAAGASFDTEDPGDVTFSSSCWDDRTGMFYVALKADEDNENYIAKYNPATGDEVWSLALVETPEDFVGMVVIGDFLYVAWYNAAGTPASRIYKISIADGSIVGDPDPFYDTDDYAGLVFSNNSFNVLAQVGHRYLGVQTASSTGRFSVWDTSTPAVKTPAYTSASQGTYSADRAARADSDGIEYFYTAAPVTSGNIQKIKSDATVIWSYTPVSDDSVISYDKPAYRVFVLSRDVGSAVTVNAGTGLLQDTIATPGGSTAWGECYTDWRGNIYLWKNGVASNDVVALDSEYNVIWGPSTFADATHTRATALRDPDFVVQTRTRTLVVSAGRVHRVTDPVLNAQGFVTTPRGITPVTINPNSLDPNRPVVFSSQNGLYMYYVDGGTYRRYEPETDAMLDWTASAGSMPVDSTGRRARLICTWNGRTVLSGLPNEPQNIYFSAVDDPTDFDTAPAFPTATQAYVLNASNMGMIGQRVTALIAFSDDVLIVGCDGSIWQITGDPMSGGRIDNLSRETGIAWGEAFCFGPGKLIYFFSTRGGVYSLVPGGSPERVSQAISDELYNVNTSEEHTSISMVWDDRAQGLYVFIAKLARHERCTHYFFDRRYNGWWPIEFADPDFNPKCCHPFDGDDPLDRIVLIGSWDSHVRAPDSETSKDDGIKFQSYVAYGPILAPDAAELRLDEVQMMMGLDSEPVEYHIAASNEPQAALETLTKGNGGFTGKWKGAARSGTAVLGGRNPTTGDRSAAFAQYIYTRGFGRWASEGIRVRLVHLGTVRGRGF